MDSYWKFPGAHKGHGEERRVQKMGKREEDRALKGHESSGPLKY